MSLARRWLRESGSVAVITGAGVSAESGIPVFRGAAGLWRKYRAEELATPQAFARDPKLVWEWYDWRRQIIASAQPNRGHLALMELENTLSEFALVTQNVDGLHDLAGSRNILKLHGDIWETLCTRCEERRVNRDVPLAPLPPRCHCSGAPLLRPGVVWFGEMLPQMVWEKAEMAVKRASVLLIVGTSAVVYPAAGLVALAAEHGARTVEINTQRTPISEAVSLHLGGSAADLLPELAEGLNA